MDESRFYELIELARDGDGPTAPSTYPDALSGVLADLDDDEVLGFAAEYDRQLASLYTWPLWGAGYVANGGMSDDSFEYFRSWLIGKGAEAVAQALNDPDGLADFMVDGEELENEELHYAVFDVLKDRDLEQPNNAESPDEPTGQPFDEDAVDGDYPRLAEWFGRRA